MLTSWSNIFRVFRLLAGENSPDKPTLSSRKLLLMDSLLAACPRQGVAKASRHVRLRVVQPRRVECFGSEDKGKRRQTRERRFGKKCGALRTATRCRSLVRTGSGLNLLIDELS